MIDQSIHKIFLILQCLLIHLCGIFLMTSSSFSPIVREGEYIFKGDDSLLDHGFVVAADLVEEGWEVAGGGEENLNVGIFELD
jgi:hypothetical protein